MCVYTHADDADVYKLVMIISLIVVALILLIFVLLTFRVTFLSIRKRHGQYYAYIGYTVSPTMGGYKVLVYIVQATYTIALLWFI